jgi:phosphohistidine phosphatase
MQLLVIRHGKSKHDESIVNDAERPLTKKGIKRQELVSRYVKEQGFAIDSLWASGAERSIQTAKIIASTYREKGAAEEIPITIVPELYPGDANDIVQIIEAVCHDTPEINIAIVGHNPGISDVVRALAGDESLPDLATSDAAWLESDGAGRWKLVRIITKTDYQPAASEDEDKNEEM